jgi:hypothetical protein
MMVDVTAAGPDLREVAAAEGRRIRAVVQGSVAGAGTYLRDRLRSDTRGVMRRGAGVANAWRMAVYPRSGESADAAAWVWTRAPEIVDLLAHGGVVTSRKGRYLAIPTNFNLQGGRRVSRLNAGAGDWSGVRVTPAQMIASKMAFTIPANRAGDLLWCLRVVGHKTSGKPRGSILVPKVGRIRLVAGRLVAVGASRRVSLRIAKAGFVPMFTLARQITFRKKLDLEAAAEDARRLFQGLLAAGLSEA